MNGQVLALHPAGQPLGGLVASVAREALLAGPSGADPEGLALIGLLDAAGLLDRPEFTRWCLEIECDPVDGSLLYADIALDRVAAASVGDSPFELAPRARLLLSAAVVLVDMAAELHELEPAARVIAVTALARFLEVIGPDSGLTVSLSPAGHAATSPVPASSPVLTTVGGTR